MMRSPHIRLLLLLALLPLSSLSAQTSAIDKLRKERSAALQAIEETNTQISTTQKSTRSLLNELQSTTAQLESRRKVITLLGKEMDQIERQQRAAEQEIKELERELENKKRQYAKALQSISKHRAGYDRLMFLLSAESLSQTYRRMRYLQEYTNWRKEQSRVIIESQEELDRKLLALEKSRKETQTLIVQRTQERTKLEAQEGKQKRLVSSLKSRESSLRSELAKQNKAAKDLNSRIEQLIAEEARKAAEQTKTKPKKVIQEEIKLAGSFEKNRGKLPVPVSGSYLLVGRYGVHKHKDLKYVEVNSSGIDLQTKAKAEARSVFDGEVTRVFVMPGYNSSVIVRHGTYLTIYANLSQVYVKVGQKVKTAQSIGQVYSDPKEGNRTVLHFQLWKERVKQNPELWLNL